jgi:hypothetical protein
LRLADAITSVGPKTPEIKTFKGKKVYQPGKFHYFSLSNRGKNHSYETSSGKGRQQKPFQAIAARPDRVRKGSLRKTEAA